MHPSPLPQPPTSIRMSNPPPCPCLSPLPFLSDAATAVAIAVRQASDNLRPSPDNLRQLSDNLLPPRMVACLVDSVMLRAIDLLTRASSQQPPPMRTGNAGAEMLRLCEGLEESCLEALGEEEEKRVRENLRAAGAWRRRLRSTLPPPTEQ